MDNKRRYCIYKHISPSGKVYIGITSQRPEARWQREGAGYKKAGRFRNAIKKYGWENIKHEIIASGLTLEEACIAERKLIKRYDSRNPKKGYNVTAGGDRSGGFIMSEEAREKIRVSKLGEKNPMFGRTISEEHRRKLSELYKGKKFSEERREHMRIAQSNRSEETRKRMSDAHEKDKVSVVCVETGVTYSCVSEASRATKCSTSNIVACCKGRRKTTGGYHWEYAA